MARCPLTYELIEGPERYSRAGLRAISRSLTRLEPLEFSAEELVLEATRRAARMSIQGVQPKLSLVIEPRRSRFRVVDSGGRFILKPPHPVYRSLPENEDLTMRLAAIAGVETPLHGLLYARDDSLSYLVRRFDRVTRAPYRLALEDFAQLQGRTRETKYDSSVERVVEVIRTHTTFPAVELSRFFRRVLFSFLVGNEDMHLKNYSLITMDPVVALSPAYDLLNTTIVMGPDAEESALPIGGKRRGLTRRVLVDYLGGERCALPQAEIDVVLAGLRAAVDRAADLVGISFLAPAERRAYLAIVKERAARLFV